jgi:hypothetical protein
VALDLHDPLQKFTRNSVIFDDEYSTRHHQNFSAGPASG